MAWLQHIFGQCINHRVVNQILFREVCSSYRRIVTSVVTHEVTATRFDRRHEGACIDARLDRKSRDNGLFTSSTELPCTELLPLLQRTATETTSLPRTTNEMSDEATVARHEPL